MIALPKSDDLRAAIDEHGFAVIPGLLGGAACDVLAAGYDSDQFRSTIAMARHGFGRGEYKYYRYPLPPVISDLRPALYERLVPIANDWQASLGSSARYPDRHADFIVECHAAGQRFRCRSRCCCRARRTSRAGSSSSPSSGRGGSPARRWCRWTRATQWSSQCASGRFVGRADIIGSNIGTASARFDQDSAIRWE